MAQPRGQNDTDKTPPSPRDAEKKGTLTSKRPKFNLSWVLMVIALALALHFFFFLGGSEPSRIDYSTFLEYVEEGYVEEVAVVNDTRVEGMYTEKAADDGAVEVGQTQQTLFDAAPPEADRRFVTTKPEDHELTAVLLAYNERAETDQRLEPIAFDARQEENWLGGALFWLLPFGLIILFWVFMMRRMNPGSQVLSIGKSKARLYETDSNQRLTFRDVAGLDEAKDEVQEVVEFLSNPKKFTRLGGKLPKGVLLVGPPGTGKTLLAKAVAGEAGVPFFSLAGSDFVEMFVGVGASRVRDLFKDAKEKAPCIIFIDEIDAIGRSRGKGAVMGGNDERENTLNQLLVEMDGFNTDKGVILMAATNRPDVLDSALLRPGRFDRQIMIDRPDRREREAIFAVHTRNLILAEDVEDAVLASQTPGFAGAEIANVCNEAALLAARRGKDAVHMNDFEAAIDRVIGGLEKKNKLISPEEKRIVAYHEAGHAITGWYLKHTDPVVKVSIVPRGLAALGFAQYLPDERYITTKAAFIDRMTMMIGGRVAEEIIFDHLSTGAQNDLERITRLAYAMVVDYGMSERVGHVSFNLGKNDQPMFEKPYSDKTAEAIDDEVKAIIEDVRRRAHELLDERADKLEEMAQALLKKEVLGPSDLIEILGPRPHGDYVRPHGDGQADASDVSPVAAPPLPGTSEPQNS
jgi:cell division protease FtsH